MRRAVRTLTTLACASFVALSSRADAPPPTPMTAPSTSAVAAASVAVVGPVLTTSKEKGATAPLRRVEPSDPFAARAKEVELALKDAAEDLNLAIDLTATIPRDGADDLELIKRATDGAWVISPRFEATGTDRFILRLLAVAPHGVAIVMRVEEVDGARIAARAVVMLRDLVSSHPTTIDATPKPDDSLLRADDEPGRSRGRPILAVSLTLFGLYSALSIERSAGSDDPRLLYPLLALGSGIGVGAALLVSDEWDVTQASAWTIAGGTWWGVVSGLEIARGRNLSPASDRLAWGLGGGLIGTGLATAALTFARYDDGDAALVHSGAAIGALGGGLIDLIVRGSLQDSAATGVGIGSAVGLVGGGLLATVVDASSQRVLLIDIGAGVGALGGGAIASPLIFKDETPTKDRLFSAAMLGGTLVGGLASSFATHDEPRSRSVEVHGHTGDPTSRAPVASVTSMGLRPTGGVIGVSEDPKTHAMRPIMGFGILGEL